MPDTERPLAAAVSDLLDELRRDREQRETANAALIEALERLTSEVSGLEESVASLELSLPPRPVATRPVTMPTRAVVPRRPPDG